MKLFAMSNVAFARSLIVFIFFLFSVIFFVPSALAATTPFRSANIITTDGTVSYTNLNNCSVTDGATCDRATNIGYGNLYFRDFGNYSDFGMPFGSTITNVRIRVTGKATASIYVGLSPGQTFTSNCQWPSDLWTLWQLNSNTINTQMFVTQVKPEFTPNGVLSYCLQSDAFQNKNFIWRINYSSGQAWSANIDNFEIAFDYEPGAIPTPTPTPTLTLTPTPTPTPTPIPTPVAGPAPFLDLPWDYEGKGLSFSEAALSINSYFDHEYPLLSSGLSETNESLDTIINFRNPARIDRPYSSHDGYDYGNPAQVHNGDPVFAAADGCASYSFSSAGGNIIKIDHGNYYQTRYLHLQDTGLVTEETISCVRVTKGQQVGLVGSTGNSSGAHIHFGVFEDKNKDGSFDDNVPDGVTDPFGWQSKAADPWAIYTFFYNGQNRTGNKSYYLWKKKIDNLDATLTSNGAVFNMGKYNVNFPQGSTNQNLNLNVAAAPIAKTLDNIRSIGTSIIITATDSLGNLITNFSKLFSIGVDFSSLDLSRYNQDTLSIYSSTDGQSWKKETTVIDFIKKTATVNMDHLTHFALMAERADILPPTTTAILDGIQGQQNWFRSDVMVILNSKDNEGGLGVDYTLYKKDEGDWDTYKEPLVFNSEGHHKIEFYSVDNDENIETKKLVEFDIDKTIPEAKIQFDTNAKDLVIFGVDNSGYATVNKIGVEKNREQFTITDRAGNSLTFISKDRRHGKEAKLSLESLTYNNNATITLDKNKLYVEYSLDKDKDNIRELEQKFEIKDEIKIKIKYDSKKDKSTIITKVKGTEKIKEIRSGLILLQIKTEKGTLKYSY